MANDVGNITASLKLESAAFIRDLTKASQATARNTSAMQRHMAGLRQSFAAVGSQFKTFAAGFVSIAAVRGLQSLGQTAIQVADDIGAAAAKIGISGEELQRLRFAAQQTDVEIGDLDNAIKLFQKNLATGKIESQSFSELIQSIREAPTHIEKVSIATEALGGKAFQTGILLASAGDQFTKNFQSAFVVSEKALQAASDLDNEWRALTAAIATGFQTGFLESFADGAKRSHEELTKFNEAAKILGGLFGGIVSGFASAASAAVNFRQTIFDLREDIRKQQAERAGETFLPTLDFSEATSGFDLSLFDEAKVKIDEFNQSVISQSDAAKLARDANAEWLERLSAGASIFEATRSPLEALAIEIQRLSELYRQGSIDAETFGRAQVMASAAAISPWLQVADTIGGALGTLFKDNQAVAIAQAIINTAQGITAALAQYPPPLSFAMAAAQAAAGAAQIATIKSTKPGTSGSVKKPSAGGGKGSTVSSDNNASEQPVQLIVQGDTFGKEHIVKVARGLVEFQRDGGRLVIR